MKQFLLSLSFLGCLMAAQAQQKHQCGTDGLHDHKMATDAVYAKRMHDFDARYTGGNIKKGPQTAGTYVIPVVVHVMHKGEALGVGTNITDEEIRNQIKAVNERFRKAAGSVGDGNGADTGFEFALAVRDPQGNCTNGITRTDMTNVALYMNNGVQYDTNGSGITDGALKALDYWDSNRYYNIWIVSEFDNGMSAFSGYAYYASAHGLSYDGAVILSDYFANSESITTTHELGHAFNLYHTFEGDAAGTACPTVINGCGTGLGDCCLDTAPHIRNTDCTTTGTNSCDPTNTDLSFKHNYMTYSVAYNCQNMFSNDQKNRAIDAATLIRGSLLAANGNMSLVPPALTSATFTISTSIVCLGNSVNLMDASSCIPKNYLAESAWAGINFTWTITNGTGMYVFNTQNVNFTPPVAGTYSINLAITMGNATFTTTMANAITVLSNAESVQACIPDPGQVGNFGYSVNNVVFNNINNETPLSIGGYENFKCSSATSVYTGSTYPLSVSIKSGNSYTENYRAYIDYNNNGSFEAGEMVASGSVPNLTAQTFTTDVTIPANAVQGSLLTMRVIGEAIDLTDAEVACTAEFYVADIEDYGIYIMVPLGTTEFSAKTITMAPNPANSLVTLSAQSEIESVTLYNMLGQVVLTKTVNATQSDLDVSGLSAGTYVVHASAQGKTAVLKLVKQ
ncbi:zinc-dependent metalloprotease [Flavobacterium subsaxonicum]|nr:zinc-dependent metalloprotease [Flavobacterium subsaxonicum]